MSDFHDCEDLISQCDNILKSVKEAINGMFMYETRMDFFCVRFRGKQNWTKNGKKRQQQKEKNSNDTEKNCHNVPNR